MSERSNEGCIFDSVEFLQGEIKMAIFAVRILDLAISISTARNCSLDHQWNGF